MGWFPLRWLLLWVLCRLLNAEIGICDTQSCIEDFSSKTKGLREGPYRPYCVHLRHYMHCVQDQSQACHGNILFHGIKISVETLMVTNRCEQILAQEGPQGVNGDDAYPVSTVPEDPCGYKGPTVNPAQCGLFGDPHLKIFNGTFMTCRVKGAWPMLSSSHLAIQVTNEEVAPDFKATAITKVTVLIKSNPTCGPAKTYEASSESLPKAFTDGTTFSGTDISRPFANVTESQSGRHVLINIKTINTVVSIRKIGSYLSVSVTMPEEIVETLSDAMQLCISGCPASEQLREHAISGPENPAMSESEALKHCLENNITDYFLDSCVFDLVTSGDLTFRDAAALSLKDLWREDPKSSNLILKNCSSWPCVWRLTSSGQDRACPNFVFLFSLTSFFLSYILYSSHGITSIFFSNLILRSSGHSIPYTTRNSSPSSSIVLNVM